MSQQDPPSACPKHGTERSRNSSGHLYCRDCNREHHERYDRTPAGRATQARRLRTVSVRFRTAMRSATKRGWAWELSLAEYTPLISQPCHYCGNPLNGSGAGLDRLDGAAAYTCANVVPSCWPCNYLRNRGQFTVDEMRSLGPVLGTIWRRHGPAGTGGRPRLETELPESA